MLDVVGAAFARLLIVLCGYLIGMFVFTIALICFRSLREQDLQSGPGSYIVMTLVFFLASAYLFIKPVGLAIFICELLGLRGLVVHVAAWALAVFCVATSVSTWPQVGDDWVTRHDDLVWGLSATAGGFAYWAIAGRLTRPRRSAPKFEWGDNGSKASGYIYRRP